MTAYERDRLLLRRWLPDPGALRVVTTTSRVLAFPHPRSGRSTSSWIPKRHLASLTTVTSGGRGGVRALLAVVQAVARDVEREHGAAAVLDQPRELPDSRHLHVHVHCGRRRRDTP